MVQVPQHKLEVPVEVARILQILQEQPAILRLLHQVKEMLVETATVLLLAAAVAAQVLSEIMQFLQDLLQDKMVAQAVQELHLRFQVCQ